MKIKICFIMILLLVVSAAAYAQKEEKVTIVSYYPSPEGVYQTIRLVPGNAPENPKSGQLYFNSTTGFVQYYNKTGWVNITQGGSTNNTVRLENRSTVPADATPGRIYFNDTAKTPMYLNNEGKWVNWTGGTLWTERNWGSYCDLQLSTSEWFDMEGWKYNNRRVGIGTRIPMAPLHVHINEESGANELEQLFTVTKNLTGTAYKPQSLSFMVFPEGTYKPYLDNASVIFVPRGNLMLTASDPSQKVTFNVGGYNSSASEVMYCANPGGESAPTPRVGIGNSTPPFALFVDSKESNATVFGIRGKDINEGQLGVNTITIYNDSAWLTNSFYLENNTWKNDKRVTNSGQLNTRGAALIIDPSAGMRWVWYNASGLANNNTTVASFTVSERLWDRTGARLDPSRRALKENFTPINPDYILKRLDQLEVSRWNFKAETKPNSHIGPMAEDFNRLFELGTAQGYIASIDQAGVPLAAVKALSQKLENQQKKIKELEAELKYLVSQPGSRQ